MSLPHDIQVAVLAHDLKLPKPVAEHRFAAPRKWRFDFAWPPHKVALEVEGGIWVNGAHTRGKHFLSDIEKYNRASELGWRVVRCTPQTIMTGMASVRACITEAR